MKGITSENAHKHAQMQYLKTPTRDLQLSKESATHRKHKAFWPSMEFELHELLHVKNDSTEILVG